MEQFKWTLFYSEFATSLLKYAENRMELIEKVKEIYKLANIKLPTLEKDNNIVDIDPFTVFGLFNKGITDANRVAILNQIKMCLSSSRIFRPNTNFQEIESQEQLSVGKCLWQSTNIDRRTQQWKIVEKCM